MSAHNPNHQRSQSSTHTHAAMLPRLVAILAIACALTGIASAAPGDQASGQRSTSPAQNPYSPTAPGVTEGAQSGQVPAVPGNTIQTSGPTLPGIQSLGSGVGNGAPSTALLYPDPTQYTLAPGDLISVRLYAVPDYNAIVRISKDGTVVLPLISSISLGGITIRQAEDLIASALKTAGMYTHPEVIIGLAESGTPQTISFAGEKNGVYLVQGQRSLLDVIAGSGGLPLNSSRTVSIIRPGVDAPIVVNLGNTPQELVKANIPVYPRDTIFVERAGSVYILGAFKTQGAFPLPPTGMTLMQAAALANGPGFAGKYNDMRIVRTNGTERTEVKVDINRIIFGLDPDPLLQPGDILFLPTTPLKRILAAGGLSTLLSAVSVLLIAIYQR